MVSDTLDSDLYPSLTFRDPLLFPLYIKTNDPYSIWNQTQGDWLINAYVNKLNNEIIDDITEFADYKETLVEIMNATRVFGWCVVQFYKNDVVHVFTPLQFAEWLKEPDANGKNTRVGIRVKWTDDLQNSWEDSLYFDDRKNENGDVIGKAYLFIWEKGNGTVIANSPSDSAFAIADCSNSVLSLAIQCRQIQATLTFSATNPYFLHFVYGDSISDQQRAKLVAQIAYASTTSGIGAKKSVLETIEAIETSSTEKSILAISQMIAFFASATRLPLSYYLGEKQTGGLGDTGEQTDEVKVAQKKEFVLQHFLPGFSEIFVDQFSITLPDLSKFYSTQIEEEQQHQEELQMQSKSKSEVKTQ